MPGTHRQRGAAAVEFALVLPVLVALLLGIMEFGYMFYAQASVSNAARAGVRNYAINYATSGAETTSKDFAKSMTPDPTKATATMTATCSSAGTEATMVITYKFTSPTGLLGNSVTLTGTGDMRCGG